MIKGIVSSVKISPDERNNVYTILSDKVIVARSATLLELYEKIEISGISDGFIAHKVIGEATSEEYKKMIKRHVDSVKIKENLEKAEKESSGEPYFDSLKKMEKNLHAACESFIASFISGSPIIARFHNDGDGASGAVALSRALQKIQEKCFDGERGIAWTMHRGIDYDIGSFSSDSLVFNSYKSIEKPLIFITDFGTAPGSESAIKKFGNFYNVIWLDHHPLYEGFPKGGIPHYINTWEFGSDSNFTAGLLTCLFSKSLYNVNAKDMIGASLISDYSTFADRKDKSLQRTAIIIDYLTSVAERRDSGIEKLTPNYIDNLLNSKERSDNLFSIASNTLNEALELGVKSVREYKCKNWKVFVLDFENIPKSETGFPLPGRYSSRLQERLESLNGNETITVVYYGNYITVRLSKHISSKVGLLKIIGNIVKNEENAESGGGHNEAASIRLREKAVKPVLNAFLRELGVSQPS